MPLISNAIFKLVSLRTTLEGLSVDPTEDIRDSQVVVMLNGIEVNPADPSEKVLSVISGLPVIPSSEMETYVLTTIRNKITNLGTLSFEALASLRVGQSGESGSTIADYAVTEEFHTHYKNITDSWIVLGLQKKPDELLEKYKALIRIAHLCFVLAKYPGSLKEPGIIQRLISARVIFPRQWRPEVYRQNKLKKAQIEKEKAMPPPAKTARQILIEQKIQELKDIENKIEIREALQSKTTRLYRTKLGLTVTTPGKSVGLPPAGTDTLIGVPVKPVKVILDGGFYTDLGSILNQAEKLELTNAIGNAPDKMPSSIETITDRLEIYTAVIHANNICKTIRIWEEEDNTELPQAPDFAITPDRPSVRTIGWGDLIVARERLVGYEAKEIAHIENVLAGEEKVREHERTRTTTQFTETETTEKTETEKDLQTTDRFELQSQAEKTIDTDFSIDAGINTSGKYGLTSVNTSLDASFSRSISESKSSSLQLAKEVVSRSVERVFESVRKLRRLTISEQIRELNKHTISNIPVAGSQLPAQSISGVYLWVEKIHEIELRHYGTRMMLEFHVPEPAVSLLERARATSDTIQKPAPFSLNPSDIKQSNYLCLTRLYGAQDIEPPPAQFVQVGFNWNSTPDEDANANKAEDTFSKIVSIPDGYIPIIGKAKVKALSKAVGDSVEAIYYSLMVAGTTVLENTMAREQTIKFMLAGDETDHFGFAERDQWLNGVPVTFVMHGHFDKTAVVHITVRCERSYEAFAEWQLETWEKLKEAHDVRVSEYRQAKAEADYSESTSIQITGLPEAVNRSVERDELTKWAVKLMRINYIDFNAIKNTPDGFQEVDPMGADFQAPIVRFFEESFEWRQMSYFLYPYYWARRASWKMRQNITNPDPRHEAFLRAGAARVIVPVTPGYEARILSYLDSDPDLSELERIYSYDESQARTDSAAEDLWLEVLLNRNEELALGSGTLTVEQNNSNVTINADSRWVASVRDLGRELFVDGDQYRVEAIVDEKNITLNEPYKGRPNTQARYATGSVPYGPPWLVNIPTSLIVLSEEKNKLQELSQ